MSRSTTWRTQRRSKAYCDQLDHDRRNACRRVHSSSMHTDDSDSDDEMPGAYAVSRGGNHIVSQRSLWNQSDVEESQRSIIASSITISTLPSIRDPPIRNPPETIEEQDTIQHHENLEKSPKKFCRFAVAGIAGFAVALLVAYLVGKTRNFSHILDDSSMNTCDFITDPFRQCQECFNSLNIRDPIVMAYGSLRTSSILSSFINASMSIDSCSPENVALVWVASQIAESQEDGKAMSSISISNRYLLSRIYALWDGTRWQERAHWLSNATECEWYGITCNEKGIITRLDLPSNYMKGTLDSALILLTDLQRLNLKGNELYGPIPIEFTSITSLEDLWLSGNELTGEINIPSGAFRTMKSLALSENHFVGTLPELLGLSNLIALDLSNNMLNGGIPDSWSQLSYLESMDISGNTGVSGTFPSTYWPALQSLIISQTEISGPLSQLITNYTSLEHLKADFTSLSGTIPSTIGILSNLEKLDISTTYVDGTIPSEVGSCSMLKTFHASSCQLSGTLPMEMGGLIHLQQLDVSYNRAIDGTIPSEFDALHAIIELSFVETKISGFVSNDLCKNFNAVVITNTIVNACSCCKRGQ